MYNNNCVKFYGSRILVLIRVFNTVLSPHPTSRYCDNYTYILRFHRLSACPVVLYCMLLLYIILYCICIILCRRADSGGEFLSATLSRDFTGLINNNCFVTAVLLPWQEVRAHICSVIFTYTSLSYIIAVLTETIII